MSVAAAVLAPLTVNCTAGEAAIASLKVAVIVSVVPCLTGPVGEYAIDAVGAVLSTVNVGPVVGAADREFRCGRVSHRLVERRRQRQRRSRIDRTGWRVRDGRGRGRVLYDEGGAARWRRCHHVP